MTTLQTMLAATDFSEDGLLAARRAAVLAGEHSARLRLLHILREDFLSTLRARLQNDPGVTASLVADAERKLATLSASLEKIAGSQPEMSVLTGRSVLDEVLGAADHADVLVLGARGSRPLQDQLLGTTSERLLLRSRRPMLVVRRNARALYAKVLVPIDFSTQSLAALRFAQALAPSAQFHLLHVADCPYEGKLRQADISMEVIEGLRRQCLDEARTNMANLFSRWVPGTLNVLSTVTLGNPKTLISEQAQLDDADLVVLGKHGRSAVGELFLGGVTRNALARVTCDVAVVPDHPRV